MRVQKLAGTAMAALALGLGASCSSTSGSETMAEAGEAVEAAVAAVVDTGEVPNPTSVTLVPARAEPGDPSRDYPWMTTIHPLAEAGYVEEEFFYEGTARSFDTRGDNARDGQVVSEGHPYRTRMVVRRPADMSDFNGVVLAEWQNVTAGYDLDAMWGGSYEHMMREGYVWVGISAQQVGLHREPNGLTHWSPVRYGTLDVTDGGKVTDDSLSYDIYAQGLEAIRDPQGTNVLGGATPETILAIGASQSAGRLAAYLNALHDELGDPVDAYFLMIGGGQVREDLPVPVFKLLSETDVPRQAANRQADTDKYRLWEIAGTSHSSRRTSMNRGPMTDRDGVEAAAAECDYPTYPRVPMNYPLAAVYDHMTKWVQDGVAPPTAPVLEVVDGEIQRDEHGNALGGIRLAEFDPATARNSGENTGSGFCRLYGRYEPFDSATLNELYKTSDDYTVKAFATIEHALNQGYIVEADAAESQSRASQSIYGRGGTCEAACHAAQDLLDASYFYLGAIRTKDALTSELAQVVRHIAAGEDDEAKRRLSGWRDKIGALQSSGRLSDASTKALNDGADAVLASMG